MFPQKLTALASHPIQYQAPLWRAIADSGIDLEVLFLDDQGLSKRIDTEFGASFAWDIDLLSGYRSQFVKVREPRDRARFRGIQLAEDFGLRFPRGANHFFWVDGWRFLANWQAVNRARKSNATILMRGESNGMLHRPWHKRLARTLFLRPLLAKVDYFLCIGSANKRYLQELGAPAKKCVDTLYCVDNDRFRNEATAWRASRQSLRENWRIASDAKVVLFCGKLISRKKPEQISAACQLLLSRIPNLHVLYAGTGSMEPALKRQHDVRFQWSDNPSGEPTPTSQEGTRIPATFAGFMNQSEIAKAYAVADVLVLPSGSDETWGLVVNEAMASGLPAIVSDHVGCAEDLPRRLDPRLVYRVNDIASLAEALAFALGHPWQDSQIATLIDQFHIRHVVSAVANIMSAASCSDSLQGSVR